MNFPPSYPLTLEFKRNLGKNIQKYKKFIDWKGSRKTFSNLYEGYAHKRISVSHTRPTSAAMTKNQTLGGSRMQNLSRKRRPITAKTRVTAKKAKLGDSSTNPFGSPENEEVLFSLEEKPNDESGQNIGQEEDSEAILEPQQRIVKNKGIISPIFGHSNRFKRPQSAKNAFDTINTLRYKKGDSHDRATLELKKIFEKSHDLNILTNSEFDTKSNLSKPPIGKNGRNRLRKKPVMTNYDNFESIMELHRSDIDPTKTLNSLPSNKMFEFTSRMTSKNGPKKIRFTGNMKPLRAVSKDRRATLNPYSAHQFTRPKLFSKKVIF